MLKRISIWSGSVLSIVLMLSALYVWQNASALTYTFDKPEIAAWAARSAAVGLGAFAQLSLAVLVVMQVYRSDIISKLYSVLAGLVMLMSVAGAVVLVIAGR